MALKASTQGIEIIEALASKKGWNKSSIRWADKASVGVTTLKRFNRCIPIRKDNFISICQAIGIDNWETIVDYQTASNLPKEVIEVSKYIDRPPIEQYCFQEIQKPGALIRIKAPRKMGKTELMRKIINYAENYGYRAVSLSLLHEDSALDNLDTFLQDFCRKISRRLNLPNRVADLWDPAASSNINCTEYLEEYILTQLDTPLVLGLDNVDGLFQHPATASDFFRLLRSWHEEAKSVDSLKQLRLVVSHSTEVYIPLKINHSPFNVGLPIVLTEFTMQQVQDLVNRYSLDWPLASIEKLMAMVGGHPYLVQQALEDARQFPDVGLEHRLVEAPTTSGIYHNHLSALWEYLEQDPELMVAMEKVVMAEQPMLLKSNQAFKLHSLGLVKLQGDNVAPRCRLYRLYFRHRFEQG